MIWLFLLIQAQQYKYQPYATILQDPFPLSAESLRKRSSSAELVTVTNNLLLL
jgi:hypothetical protein